MSAKNPPEITLELTGGSLVIRTAEAVYKVLVAAREGAPALAAGSAAPPALPQGETAELPPPKAPAAADTQDWDSLDLSTPENADELLDDLPTGVPEDEEYYRDLSHDMFREVGRLARRLSMSIRDVKVDHVDEIDLESAGDQLEDAKDQLENVVKMTEKATMRIMDLGEDIQTAINAAQNIMNEMTSLESEAAQEMAVSAEEAEAAKKALLEAVSSLPAPGKTVPENLPALAQKAAGIRDALAKLAGAPAAEPAPEPEPEPAAPAGPYYSFPLDLVFQTVYELCTNEAVKKHIKAMWDNQAKGFNQPSVEKALNELVTEAPDEDNFLNLDLKGVLKTLFAATTADSFKQVLKKMASTADQIFLDQTLPLEAAPVDSPPAEAPAKKKAPAPAAAAPQGVPPELLARFDELVSELNQAARPAEAEDAPEKGADLKALVERALASAASLSAKGVHPELRSNLDQTMQAIVTSVNSIIEALSFQDLSGQTIYRIVRLLTDFQVQLLAMVVSFGYKIKAKNEDEEITSDQSEKLAQEEVDKVMGKIGGAEDEAEEEGEAKLDQSAINDLLDSMGF